MTDKPAKKTSMLAWIALGAIVFTLYKAADFSEPAPPPPKTPPVDYTQGKEAQALKHICRDLIRENLNDPSSAEFDPASKHYGEHKGEGRYVIQVGVRAKNAFNALVYNLFECQFSGNSSGGLIPTSVKRIN